MRLRLLVALVVLLGSLSLAAPSAWAAPIFTVDDLIAPVVFYTSPRSRYSAPPPNSVILPGADSTKPITYTITNGCCSPITTCPAASRSLPRPGPSPALPRRSRPEPRRPTTYYFATGEEGSNSLLLTLEVVDERAVLEAFYTATDGATWTTNTNWVNPIPTTTCLGDLHGGTLSPFSNQSADTVT